MACSGCGGNGVAIEGLIAARSPGRGEPGRVVALAVVRQQRDREAMCSACPFREVGCLNGADTDAGRKARQDHTQTCWAGRWPDREGVVRLDGISYAGVPMLIRMRLGAAAAWRAFARHVGTDRDFSGCGCIRALLWAKPLVPWGRRGWGTRLAEAFRRARKVQRERRAHRRRQACLVHGSSAAQGPTPGAV